MSLKILISTSSFGAEDPRPLQVLEEKQIQYLLNPFGRKLSVPESIDLMREVDGLIAGTEILNRDVLSQAPKLKVISRVGVGMDSVDLEAAKDLGIKVINTADAHVDAVAELALAGILDALRRITWADRQVREKKWTKPMGSLLRGKTVGIVGLGRVGKALVKLLQPFDNKFLAFDPVQDEVFAKNFGVQFLPLEQLLRESDIITLHLSYSGDLRHMINAERLALLKPGVVLINCARGGLLDETALRIFLLANPGASAYLDTFEEEPYEGGLIDLPNVVLSPHIGSYAREVRVQMEIQAVLNLYQCFSKQREQDVEN